MKLEEALKIVDLFIDDELPVELASEFKQAMFEHPALREEVSSLRAVKEQLEEAMRADAMTAAVKEEVYARIVAETAHLRHAAADRATSTQMRLPFRGAYSPEVRG